MRHVAGPRAARADWRRAFHGDRFGGDKGRREVAWVETIAAWGGGQSGPADAMGGAGLVGGGRVSRARCGFPPGGVLALMGKVSAAQPPLPKPMPALAFTARVGGRPRGIILFASVAPVVGDPVALNEARRRRLPWALRRRRPRGAAARNRRRGLDGRGLYGSQELHVGLLSKLWIDLIGEVFQGECQSFYAGSHEVGQVWVVLETLKSRHGDAIGVGLRSGGRTGKHRLLERSNLALHD